MRDASKPVYATNVELQAMMVGRDVLIEQIFSLMGQEAYGVLWRDTVEALDKQILSDDLGLDELVAEAARGARER